MYALSSPRTPRSTLTHRSIGGHTNTERGYLPWLAKDIKEFIQEEVSQPTDPAEAELLKDLEVFVSQKDEHPLVTV